jgi:branched-chain amino acid transport system substrate-binding protein
MRRAATLLSLALVLGLSLVAAGCGGDDDDEAGGETTTTAAATTDDGGAAAADCTGSIGVMAPITGDAASIGQEQLNFTKFAISEYNEENGTSFELVEGDTQLDPAQASTVAQRFVSDDDIIAVIGPAGSQEVEAVAPLFTRENLGFVGASATKTELTTSGDFPTFHRVVPNDSAQGPTIGEFISGELDAQNVFIIDDQTSYSTGLADSATEALEEADVTVERDSVNQDQSDFSALVSRAADADVVFLPWQLANKGQVFAQQLQEQGSDAVVFGSDGLFSSDFTAEGAYVSSFAPDITAIESSADLVEAYEAEYGEFTSTFGPPMFAATTIALEAITAVCEEGEPTREAVAEQIGETELEESILGGPLGFDENGDVEGAQFYIFRVLGGGEYEPADQ